MNLTHLNLDLYDLPYEEEKIQITIFLIAAELKSRKLVNGLTSIGCDSCFCIPELCDLVLAMIGFNDRPNELYEDYFDLLDEHCDKVSHENDLPVKEAVSVYKSLKHKAINSL